MIKFFLDIFTNRKKKQVDPQRDDVSYQVADAQIGESMESHVFLDCKDMLCPKPIFEISMKTKNMEKGQILKVICQDIAFKADVQAWSKRTGNQLLELNENGGGLATAFIKIKS